MTGNFASCARVMMQQKELLFSHASVGQESLLFCQMDNEQQLFSASTDNAGKTLQDAIEKSNDQLLRTIINCCISPYDAHAMDIKYHKPCWTKHVFHVLWGELTVAGHRKRSPFATGMLD